MRRKFADKESEQFYVDGVSRILPAAIQKKARRQLFTVVATENLRDLEAPPGNRLKKLKDSDPPRYSIRINDQYRITFEWHGGAAWEIKVEDYH